MTESDETAEFDAVEEEEHSEQPPEPDDGQDDGEPTEPDEEIAPYEDDLDEYEEDDPITGEVPA